MQRYKVVSLQKWSHEPTPTFEVFVAPINVAGSTGLSETIAIPENEFNILLHGEFEFVTDVPSLRHILPNLHEGLKSVFGEKVAA